MSETITVCGHCGRVAFPVEVCATCKGTKRVSKFESGGDSSKGTGWANLSSVPCPDCASEKE
jgi:hypothetical protein